MTIQNGSHTWPEKRFLETSQVAQETRTKRFLDRANLLVHAIKFTNTFFDTCSLVFAIFWLGSLVIAIFDSRSPFLTRVHSCSPCFYSCSLVFAIFWLVFTRVHSWSPFLTRVRHFWFVFTRVRLVFTRVHSCSPFFDSCSLVFTRVHHFWLVFTRVHSC